jgi:hypothetical protein
LKKIVIKMTGEREKDSETVEESEGDGPMERPALHDNGRGWELRITDDTKALNQPPALSNRTSPPHAGQFVQSGLVFPLAGSALLVILHRSRR